MSFDARTHYQDVTIAERYDRKRFTSLSGRLFQRADEWCMRRVLRRIPRGIRILDGPCGTGRLMPIFLRAGHPIVGADVSGEMIAVARRRTTPWSGRAAFCRMDFAHIPLRDRAVGAVFSIRFLVHIPPTERVQMLREFRRVSERWVVVSMSRSSPWHRLRRLVKRWLGQSAPVRHAASNTELAAELREAGLREVRRHRSVPVLSEQIVVVCEPMS